MEDKFCPRCRKSVKPIPIVYGYPSDELFAEAAAGRVRLGGCVIADESSDYACPEGDALLPYVNEGAARIRARRLS